MLIWVYFTALPPGPLFGGPPPARFGAKRQYIWRKDWRKVCAAKCAAKSAAKCAAKSAAKCAAKSAAKCAAKSVPQKMFRKTAYKITHIAPRWVARGAQIGPPGDHFCAVWGHGLGQWCRPMVWANGLGQWRRLTI